MRNEEKEGRSRRGAGKSENVDAIICRSRCQYLSNCPAGSIGIIDTY